jgi:hypothetical protein
MVSQILDEMVAIGNLSRIRQRPLDCIRIGTGPISADDFNFWVTFELRQDRFGCAIWQELKGLARLDVD